MNKYHVSIGNGHCEIEQFKSNTIAAIKLHFRTEYPTREERAQLYVNVRLLHDSGCSTPIYCKPLKLLSFYKLELDL